MQVFNRHVSARGLTVFGFETVLITGAILLAAQMHGSFEDALGSVWQVVLITGLCELCFYYNGLYDLTVVHSTSELAVRILQGAGAVAIVLAVNIVNFTLGSTLGRLFGLKRSQQVTNEFSAGMRSNGTALVVGLASFPHAPLVTVPAAIYIIFQHLVAGIVKARQQARYGEAADAIPAAAKVAHAANDTPASAAATARAA